MPTTISHYQVIKVLGQGAMGIVYLCLDEKLKRQLAVKVLSEKYSADPAYRQRFLTEARSASALNHPSIVTIYEIGTDRDRDFIAMEYVEGQTLEQCLLAGGALPVDKLLAIAAQIAKGLAAAHQVGIVHRDLKPGNVIVTPDGQAKILDFGLARQSSDEVDRASAASADAATVAASYTQPGMILGTPGFMSPEQARGEKADHRSDQFSYGCLLHAMATGKAPFAGDSVVDVLHKVLHGQPEPIGEHRSDLPSSFMQILERCLSKKPSERFQDTSEIVSSLHDVQVSLHDSGHIPAGAETEPRATSARIHKGFFLLGGAAVIALAALLVFALKPFSPTTTVTVSAQDEEGHSIERQVLTREYGNRVGIVPFHSTFADTSRLWLAFAAADLISWDLIQDYNVYIDPLRDLLGVSEFVLAAHKAGYDDVTRTPLPLRREVAKKANCSHLVTGTIGPSAEGLTLQVELYDIKGGKLASSFQFSGAALPPLVDQASRRIREQLGIPDDLLESWPDLPVVDITTNSDPALEFYARAVMIRDVNNQNAKAQRYLERAIAEDPGFAMALWSKWYLLQMSNLDDPAQANTVLNTLMNHLYRLPERIQFSIKATYLRSQGENERALAVLRMWRDLYPFDIFPRETLLMFSRARGDVEETIATLEALLELEPDNPDYLQQAASELQRVGRFNDARGYLETYAELHPDDHQALVGLASLLQTLGQHESARTQLKRAQLMDPADPEVRIALAQCEFKLGDLTSLPTVVKSILDEKLGPDERLQSSLELAKFYALTGRLQLADEVCRRALAGAAAAPSPLWTLLVKTQLADQLAEGREKTEALALLNDITTSCPQPFRPLAVMVPISIYLELGDLEKAEAAARDLEALIESLNLEMLRFKWMETMGGIREQQSNYEEALTFFNQRASLSPSSTSAYFDLGRCLRKSGDLEGSQTSLQLALTRSPYNPRVLMESAVTKHALGDQTTACSYLERALSVWANADSTYSRMLAARDTLRAWRSAN